MNFGADLYYVYYRRDRDRPYGVGVGFPIAGHWEFYFTEKFSFFAELGVNIFLHPGVFRNQRFFEHPAAWVLAAVGIRFRFSDHVNLFARAGIPYSALGLGFEF